MNAKERSEEESPAASQGGLHQTLCTHCMSGRNKTEGTLPAHSQVGDWSQPQWGTAWGDLTPKRPEVVFDAALLPTICMLEDTSGTKDM